MSDSRHNYRYTRGVGGKKPIHRQTTEKIRFKLTQEGLKNFQSTFGNLSIDEMYLKLRSEQKSNSLWYQNTKATNKLIDTTAVVVGVTQPAQKHVSGFQNGVTTLRMESKQVQVSKKRG